MIVFRLSKSRFSKNLTGKGAELCGGRWNSKGVALIYTCESRALCTTEIAVHTPLGNIPLDYEMIAIEIPDNVKIRTFNKNFLPIDWKSFPHTDSTQKLGDQFVSENKFLVLQVPSVVVQGEFNYLINPKHKDIKLVKIISKTPFDFDERLFLK